MSTKIEWTTEALVNGHRLNDARGYILVRCPQHPNAKPNGYVYEHRLVVESHLERFLERHEVVHHVNGNPSDNRIENLDVMTNGHHVSMHQRNVSTDIANKRIVVLKNSTNARKKPRIEILCACGCGQQLITPDAKGRNRRYIQGHNQRGRHWRWSC